MTDKDLALHKGLMKLLNEGDFTLKAREVAVFITVYDWVKAMPKNFERKPVPETKKDG